MASLTAEDLYRHGALDSGGTHSILDIDELVEDGFGKATRYYLMRDAKHYEPKAIAGVAYGYQHPERAALTPDDFSSGRDHSNSVLEALDFFIHELTAR